MILNPFRFALAAPVVEPVFTPIPFEDVKTGLWGAFSLSRLYADSTPAIQAINLNTGVQSAIGFKPDGSFDTDQLSTLSGGTDSVAVINFNNQLGDIDKRFAGATVQLRPKIAVDGVYANSIRFDYSAMSGQDFSGTHSAYTVFMRGKLRETSGSGVLLELGTNFNSTNSVMILSTNGKISVNIHTASGDVYDASDYDTTLNNQVHAYRIDRSQAAAEDRAVQFVNGVRKTRISGSVEGTTGPTFANAIWYLGARVAGSIYSTLDLHTLMIYTTPLTDAQIAGISASINALP